MKQNKKLTKPVKSVSQELQPTEKISHWKKIRMKRKLMKKQALEVNKDAQRQPAVNSKGGKHNSVSDSHNRKKKKVRPNVVNADNKNGQICDLQRTPAQQTVLNDKSVKKHSEKGKKGKWKRKKKLAKNRHVEQENVTRSVNENINTTSGKVKETAKKDNQPLIVLPKTPAEFSSNWKKLQSTLQSKRKRTGAPLLASAKKRKTETHESQKKPETSGEDIWFDDVDDILIEKSGGQQGGREKENTLVLPNATTKLTKALAMDCEMVGVGKEGQESVLARVSLVNQHGYCVYDKFVKPREKVTDFRTHVSGIRPVNMQAAEDFLVVQKEVADLLKGRLLVGHALHNDLKVLFLEHARSMIRDTSQFKPFQELMGTKRPSLKKLTAKALGVSVQEGEHNSVQDAQAAMRLYTLHRKRWDQEIKQRRKKTSS